MKGDDKEVYQNCCKKCGSISLHTEVKGNNTGLYCDDCGAWVKWLGKDELRAFEHSSRKSVKQEDELIRKSDVLGLIENIKCDDSIPKNDGTLLDIMRFIRVMPPANRQ